MFTKQSVMFATVHVVGSNNGVEPWLGIAPPTDSCDSPRLDRIAEFERRQAAALAWLDEVFAAAAGTKGLFLMIQANPYNAPSNPVLCPSGFQAFLARLEALAQHTPGRSCSRTAMTTSSLSISRCPTSCFRGCSLRRDPRSLGQGARRPQVERRVQHRTENRQIEFVATDRLTVRSARVRLLRCRFPIEHSDLEGSIPGCVVARLVLSRFSRPSDWLGWMPIRCEPLAPPPSPTSDTSTPSRHRCSASS